MTGRLAIVGCGAVTPVGLSAAATCAAIRAGVNRYMDTDIHDRAHGPTLRAEVPMRPSLAEGDPLGRLVCMATEALRDCMTSAGIVDLSRWPLYLGIREPHRASASRWRDSALLPGIAASLGVAFHPASRLFPEGNASALYALDHATRCLDARDCDGCIVGGVDSLLHIDDSRQFGAVFRLRSDEVALGFVPGESAAMFAVTRPQTRGACEIRGIGLAREDALHTVLGEGEPHARGLSAAVRTALEAAGLAESLIDFRVSDSNGERYRAHESMLVVSRVYRSRRENMPVLLPAAAIGEVGAASGALAVVLAETALRRGYAPGRVAICESSSDGGARAACLIVQPPVNGLSEQPPRGQARTNWSWPGG